MPALREALEGAGFKDVQTYVLSGNVVLGSRAKPETVRKKVEKVLGETSRSSSARGPSSPRSRGATRCGRKRPTRSATR
jgi:hypothetical protein